MARRTGSPPTIGMAHVGLAEVGYERDDLPAAAQHATVAIEHCRRLAYALALVAGLVTLARIRQAEGDPVGALAAVDEAEAAMPQSLVDLRYPVSALRARLALAGGNLAEAARWVRAAGSPWTTSRSIPASPSTGCSRGCCWPSTSPPPRSSCWSGGERWRSPRVGSASVLRLRVLEALPTTSAGDPPAALTALTEALVLAAPERYLRVFLDEGAPIAALLRELTGRSAPRITSAGVPSRRSSSPG